MGPQWSCRCWHCHSPAIWGLLATVHQQHRAPRPLGVQLWRPCQKCIQMLIQRLLQGKQKGCKHVLGHTLSRQLRDSLAASSNTEGTNSSLSLPPAGAGYQQDGAAPLLPWPACGTSSLQDYPIVIVIQILCLGARQTPTAMPSGPCCLCPSKSLPHMAYRITAWKNR